MWISFGCGDGDVATATSGGETSSSAGTTAEMSSSGATGTSSESSGVGTITTSSSDATATSSSTEDTGPETECTPFEFSCPPGYACVPDAPGFGSCVPIPRGGCTDVVPCPEGFMCDNHFRTELGSCVPIESDTSSSGDSGTSTGA